MDGDPDYFKTGMVLWRELDDSLALIDSGIRKDVIGEGIRLNAYMGQPRLDTFRKYGRYHLHFEIGLERNLVLS